MPVISIAAAAAHLNDHSRMFAADIRTKTRLGLEMETLLPMRSSEGEYYVCESASTSELMQPYQGAFTPKGTITHDEATIRVRPIKLDIQFTETDLKKWWDTWKNSRFEAGKDPQSWTFPRYIYEKELLPKVQSELNAMAWSGVYAAPTPGTPGASIDSVDGFKKVIADQITALKIPAANVIATGAITAANARDKLEEFLDAIPEEITKMGGQILMAPAVRRLYFRDYRSEFTTVPGTYGLNEGPKEIMVDDYNVTLVSVASMAGSQRLIFLPKNSENMVWVTREGYPTYPELIFDSAPRVLNMYATIYRGFGFEYPEEIYVNNQV